ncbi:MAG TPA: XdhC family protein [Pyrinomonadaceae bacterium]|nr:XdhC family protein [Pyrinomonadaceae bacterium]
MPNEIELWRFVHSRLQANESVMLLVVAESHGSSPGRAGYKMVVGTDGELCGSIGGGVMEVNLVEQARALLSEPGAIATGYRNSGIRQQVHQRNSPNASGMICSGRQTVIFRRIGRDDLDTVASLNRPLEQNDSRILTFSQAEFAISPGSDDIVRHSFQSVSEAEFLYRERLGVTDEIYIIGGGHCSLALSELMSKLGFYISIFDDRPDLNTIAKNEFADSVTIIDSYEAIASRIPSGEGSYVVVMTLGYFSDAVVIKQLIDHDLKYFGVLGSEAKMATLMRTLAHEGHSADKLARIHTPIGLPINSHTPEEIAVSIAAEIIAVKNGAGTAGERNPAISE